MKEDRRGEETTRFLESLVFALASLQTSDDEIEQLITQLSFLISVCDSISMQKNWQNNFKQLLTKLIAENRTTLVGIAKEELNNSMLLLKKEVSFFGKEQLLIIQGAQAKLRYSGVKISTQSLKAPKLFLPHDMLNVLIDDFFTVSVISSEERNHLLRIQNGVIVDEDFCLVLLLFIKLAELKLEQEHSSLDKIRSKSLLHKVFVSIPNYWSCLVDVCETQTYIDTYTEIILRKLPCYIPAQWVVNPNHYTYPSEATQRVIYALQQL